jgi:hypothetical protein
MSLQVLSLLDRAFAEFRAVGRQSNFSSFAADNIAPF